MIYPFQQLMSGIVIKVYTYDRSLYIREACLILKAEHMIDNLQN